jgi:hypothetical protein
LFQDLLRRLQSALAPAPPEAAARYQLIDEWIEGLPLEVARRLAHQVLDNPEWFQAELGDASSSLAITAPDTVREFYGRYRRATGRYCDVQLVAAGCGPSDTRPELMRVGRDDAHVELCVRKAEDRIYLVADDVGADEPIEGSVPSIYHAVVRVAAVLDYVPGPAAA